MSCLLATCLTLSVLPACQTTRPVIGLACPIAVISVPQEPVLNRVEWRVIDDLFYTDEENFDIYVSNLENLINYSKSLQAQNIYYVDAIESCEE
jgi:hypothetical protein